MSKFNQQKADMIHRCQDCGEIGRYKQVMNVRGRLKLYCHDEEKSCYNYVLLKMKEPARV